MGGEADAHSTDAFLGGQLSIIQPKKGYRAGSDAVFLAASCPVQPDQTVLELGCGVGTALLCIARRVHAHLTGVELVPDIAALARKNAELNEVDAQIVTADLADLPDEVKSRRFDHVIMNPPYFGSGTASDDAYRSTARLEQLPLADWIETGLKRVAPGGDLTLIHTATRLSSVLAALNARADCIDIKPLAARIGRPANRVIVRAKRGGVAATTLHNPLILHEGDAHIDDRASFTPEVEAILRGGKALEF